MADQIVNPTSAAQLKSRNSEPTHLGGASWDDLGGRSWDGPGGPEGYTVDASKGVNGKDTSIPASVPAEPSHLTGVKEGEGDADEVEFEFGDDDLNEMDDLDKALDEADELPEPKIDVKTESEEDDEDDDKKVVDEDADKDEDDDKKVVDEESDDEKKDDKKDDDKPDFLKNEEADDEKKDDEDEKKDVNESLKVSIKMPKMAIFESASFSSKQQKQVAAIFESAIKDTTKQVGKQIHEHYQKVHTRKLAEAQAKLETRLNTYLTVVVEEWFKANQVAVRQSLRTELSENFLNGLQALFREHYIDVPESKVDVVESLTKEVAALKQQVTEQHAQKMKLRRLAEAANKKRIVAEFSRNLSEAQAAKLGKLAEDTEYTNAKDFREKLSMLKESYFAAARTTPASSTRLPEEDVQVVQESKSKGPKTEVDAVVDALSRQTKSDW